jgi:putative tryptophan/tyrosine transport system substrate-binding protein
MLQAMSADRYSAALSTRLAGATIASRELHVMNRRAFVRGLGAVLAASRAAGAQQVGKIPRIGVLSPPEPLTAIDVLQQGLRDLGYTEGDHISIEYRSSGDRDDRFPELAADLVAMKVDVIFAVTPPAIRAAQRATTAIPIVMVLSGDPVRNGLVQSLARPGGNTTGVATLTSDLMPKRLAVLKEAVPNLKEVAVLVNPTPAIQQFAKV